ncbi:peptidylprolyl isomerase [Desulfurivibrio alkaliphilus]|uniref:Peptidyl-prolyl cis-trans isomerase n=1 Tax=Desulfurivibrio alkaliphilus (strain DSM 19089 / UNIQEM U267 / AHT2) TaxID=589865 RepID=D6Z290_DESAT|nr:peptidylprolyl isomerase [Desulfurivibrio alkaliphilus]ADH85665.1 peptidyl-prolyl cis-trans isomerase cyclophilin type [Desulfurivibrio alkaliphilus AHT 2]
MKLLVLATIFCLLLTAQGKAVAAPADPRPRVIMETTAGEITIELFAEEAPVTTANFLQYVRDGFYDGLIFHRVIPGFVIQGGGFTPDMEQRPTRAAIKNEATNGLKNLRGTLSMARTGVVDSATSQFFVNLTDNANLDHRGTSPNAYGYAVFGKVVEGMEVVDQIAAQPTASKGFFQDVPVQEIEIIKAYTK